MIHTLELDRDEHGEPWIRLEVTDDYKIVKAEVWSAHNHVYTFAEFTKQAQSSEHWKNRAVDELALHLALKQQERERGPRYTGEEESA